MLEPPRSAPHVIPLPRSRSRGRHLGEPQHQPVPAARSLRSLVGSDYRSDHYLVLPRCVQTITAGYKHPRLTCVTFRPAIVAFVGAISNVSALCISVSWLQWLCELPVREYTRAVRTGHYSCWR